MVLNEIIEDSESGHYLNDYLQESDYQYFPSQYIRHILHRYQTEHQGIIEKKLLQSGCISEIMKSFYPSISTRKLINFINLKYEIFNYIKSEGNVIKSEMLRSLLRKKRFQKVGKNLIKKMISDLEYEGRISIIIYSGRTFLNYRK
jgi:hypothetical protein